MARQYNITAPELFAKDATTTIPPVPVPGVAYRNATTGLDFVPGGYKYKDSVPPPSADFNQMNWTYSGLLRMLDKRGVLEWSPLVNYDIVPALVWGSNGKLYESKLASINKDPLTNPAEWEFLATGLVADLPDASITQKGIVQLSNATAGTSQVLAATEKAVGDLNGLKANIAGSSGQVFEVADPTIATHAVSRQYFDARKPTAVDLTAVAFVNPGTATLAIAVAVAAGTIAYTFRYDITHTGVDQTLRLEYQPAIGATILATYYIDVFRGANQDASHSGGMATVFMPDTATDLFFSLLPISGSAGTSIIQPLNSLSIGP